MNATEHALSDPARVQARLEEIEGRLADLQNSLEAAAVRWYRVKRERERAHAEAFVRAEGTAGERAAAANLAVWELVRAETAADGDAGEAEGRFESLRAVVRVLETRSNIGMSILRSQSRFGG